MRRLAGLIVFVAVCLALIRLLNSGPVQGLLGNDPSTLPDAAATSLAEIGPTAADGVDPGSRSLVVLPEDGRDAILDEFAAADTSIDLYVYLLPSDEAIEALQAAHDRGVRVRVILERDPFGGGNSNQDAFDRLDAAGIDVRWARDRFRFSHIKSFIIDDRVAGIMTLNLSWTALTANREFAVITTVAADVATMDRLFEADWSGERFEPDKAIVTSPDNSRLVVMSMLGEANESIEIYAEVLRDGQVREALIDAAARGVKVRVLIPANPADDDLLIYRELVAHGVEVRYLADAYSHAKAIVIDGVEALVGSQNLTQTSLEDNREAGVIFDDPANIGRLLAVFEADWGISLPVG